MGGEMPQMPINSPTIQQPPMGDDGMNMNDGNMNQETPQMGDMGSGDENAKEIQKLSGELSQKLGEINSSNPNSDLSKYAANMVLAQAMKGMDESDAEDVKSKLDNPQGGGNEMGQQDMNMQQPTMGESKMDFGNLVNEIVNQVISDTKKDNEMITNPKTKRKNPFNVNLN